MARFDVYENPGRQWLLLDCQANTLAMLGTRLVVPLLPPELAPKPARRLNPLFEIAGQSYVMTTQFAAAVPVRELGTRLGSLIDHDTTITAAIDMLLSGY